MLIIIIPALLLLMSCKQKVPSLNSSRGGVYLFLDHHTQETILTLLSHCLSAPFPGCHQKSAGAHRVRAVNGRHRRQGEIHLHLARRAGGRGQIYPTARAGVNHRTRGSQQHADHAESGEPGHVSEETVRRGYCVAREFWCLYFRLNLNVLCSIHHVNCFYDIAHYPHYKQSV